MIINYLGVLLFLAASIRVVTVIEADPARFPITLWGLQLVNGVVLGGMYALVALGYTLVYGILFMINFAHGDLFMVGAFFCFIVATFFKLPFIPTLLISMIGVGLLGVTIERVAYRPLRQAPRVRQDAFVACAGGRPMLFWIHLLQVQHHQVGQRQQRGEVVPRHVAARFDGEIGRAHV